MKTAAPMHGPDARAGVLCRWHHLVATDGSLLGLSRFHARHRLLLLAHDPDAFRDLGAIVEEAPAVGLHAAQSRYASRLALALAHPASRAQHLNVLEHAARSILDRLTDDERRTWSTALRDYRRDDIDLAVPQDLLRRLVRRVAPRSWAARQVYLDPLPRLRSV